MFVTEGEAARRLDLTQFGLRKWRLNGTFKLGVEYIKVNGRVLYVWPVIWERKKPT